MSKQMIEQNIQIITSISEKEKSEVYLVRWMDDFAIYKKLKGEDKSSLYRNMQNSSAVYFPKIYEIAYENDFTYVLEEYIDGRQLEEILSCGINEREAYDYIRQLTEAVACLHEMRPALIHRDIKPENIIVTPEGTLRLVDFDAAREYVGDDKEHDTRLLGTRGYASPEQFGFSQTDERSDIYSLGIVCSQILAAVRDLTPKKENECNRLRGIMDRATMFDPDRRYQSAREMLNAICDNSSVSKHATLRKKGLKWLFFVGITLVAGAIGFTIWYKNRGHIVSDSGKEQVDLTESELEFCNFECINWDVIPYEFTPMSMKSLIESQVARPNQNPSEYATFHYYSEYPQALLLYDYIYEDAVLTSVSAYRYTDNGQKLLENIHLKTGQNCFAKNGILCIGTGTLDSLHKGRYVLEVCSSNNPSQYYNLFVYEDAESYMEGATLLQGSMQYYSKSRENAIFFNVWNRPFKIQSVQIEGEVLEPSDYLLSKDERGLLLQSELLRQYAELGSVEICVMLQDGSKGVGHIVMLD